MRRFLIDFSSDIRTCSYCGSFFNTGFLCSGCWQKMPWSQNGHVLIRGDNSGSQFILKYLFDWKANENRVCDALLTSLKGGFDQNVFRKLAALHIRRHVVMSQPKAGVNLVIVPAPSKHSRADHAFAWGRALSDILDSKFVPSLEAIAVGNQKNKTRSERNVLELKGHENFSEFQGTVVFVDDIVTTGATARAAYFALGRPPHFEVWSIAYRHLAAE